MALKEHRGRITVDGLKDIGQGQYKNNTKKSVVKESNSDIIKNITIDDFKDAAIGKEIQPEILKVINDNSKESGMYYNEVVIKSVPKNNGKSVMLQTEPYFGGRTSLTRLIINEDEFAGRTLEEINDRFMKSKNTIADSLQEAVWYENGHAKLYYNKSLEEIEKINSELDAIHYKKLSPIAEKRWLRVNRRNRNIVKAKRKYTRGDFKHI